MRIDNIIRLWENMHPSVKIITILALMIMLLTAKTVAALALAVFSTLLLILLTGMDKHLACKTLKVMIPLLLITILFTSMGQGSVTYKIGRMVPFSLERLQVGITAAVRMLMITLLALSLTTTTSPFALNNGFLLLLKPLSKLGLPIEKIGLISMLSLRFIPILYRESDRISKAQIARGAVLEYGNLFIRAYHTFYLFVPILISSLRKADDIALAMDARGYCGLKGNVSEPSFSLGGIEAVALLLIAGLFFLVLLNN